MATSALVLWFGFGEHAAAWGLVATIAAAALLESAFAVCIGCSVFGVLMRAGMIPDEVCAACADLSLRHPKLAEGRPA